MAFRISLKKAFYHVLYHALIFHPQTECEQNYSFQGYHQGSTDHRNPDCNTFFGIGECEFHSFNVNWIRFLYRFLFSFWKLFRTLNLWNFSTVIFIFMGRKASFRKYLVIKNLTACYNSNILHLN